MSRTGTAVQPGPSWLRSERGISFYPQLIIAVLMLAVASTALVKNIYQAHENTQVEYRRLRALEELQAEIEYWKAAVFIYGPNHPRPNTRHIVNLDTGKRGRRNYILAEFDPAPQISLIRLNGADAYEITVAIRWPERGVMRRETLRTAINQIR
ncbi:MAG: hypothetical protein Q8O14_10845 [bacterium]|jgi:hypothetical protein|nr:hypothetical protein [bacterium]